MVQLASGCRYEQKLYYVQKHTHRNTVLSVRFLQYYTRTYDAEVSDEASIRVATLSNPFKSVTIINLMTLLSYSNSQVGINV